MIELTGMQKIADYIDDLVVSGDFTIGGVTYPASIRRSIVEGTTIKKHLYLTQDDPYGTVTRCRLLDKDGDVFASVDGQKNHEQGKGLLLEFRFTLEEV